MTELVFLLEESSTRAMLEGVIPRLFPEGVAVRYIVFEGKQDLEKQMVLKLKGCTPPAANASWCCAIRMRRNALPSNDDLRSRAATAENRTHW